MKRNMTCILFGLVRLLAYLPLVTAVDQPEFPDILLFLLKSSLCRWLESSGGNK